VEVEGILKYLEVTHLAARKEVRLLLEHLGLEAVSVEVVATQPFSEHLCSLPDFSNQIQYQTDYLFEKVIQAAEVVAEAYLAPTQTFIEKIK